MSSPKYSTFGVPSLVTWTNIRPTLNFTAFEVFLSMVNNSSPILNFVVMFICSVGYKLDTTSAIAIKANSAKGITMPYLTISLAVKPSFLKSSTISLGKLIFDMVVMF